MARPKVGKVKADYKLAVQAANEFYRQVERALSELPDDSDDLFEHFEGDIATISYLASNLIFACELYLKVIYALGSKTPPVTHNIWDLYKRIPKQLKGLIEKAFDREIAKFGQVKTITVLFSRSELTPEEIDIALTRERPKGEFLSLERALKETGDSYQLWRYYFESIKNTKNHRVLRFPINHLRAFCISLDEIIWHTVEVGAASGSITDQSWLEALKATERLGD